MQKKIRSNREYEDIFALAAHLNYYFQRNPDAQLTMNDLKKIVDRNPSFCLEEQTIDNGFQRPLISDSDGHTLSLVMAPRFFVYDDVVENGDPEDEEKLPDEEVYAEDEDESESEEEAEQSEEAEVEEVKAEEVEDDVNEYAKKFADLKEDDKIYWRDPETQLVHEATVVYIRTADQKVEDANTEITVSVDGSEDYTTIFPDEILDEDDFEDNELFSNQDDSGGTSGSDNNQDED